MRSLLARAAALLRGDDRRIVIALLLFTLAFRLLTLMMIHTGVDERDYWFSARRLLLGLPYDNIQHRTIRFTVILPVLAAQALLGTHPNVYYVVPLALSMAQVALIYRIGLRLHGRAAAFLAALALALFPYMIRGGSQVRPDIFSLTYMLASAALFLRYLEEGRPRRSLVASAVLLFVAYQAKITNLYFLPGFLAAILLLRRSRRDLLVFCAPLALLYAGEHLLLYALSGEPLGQIGIIMRNHLGSGYVEPMGFWDLFKRYSPEKLPWYWMATLILCVPAAALLSRRDRRYAALSMLVASFVFCITFAVARVRPFVPVEAFIHRYFLAALGPVLLLDASLIADALRRLRLLPALTAGRAAVLLAAGIAAAAGLFSADVLPRRARLYFNNPLRPAEHPLALNERYLRLVNGAFAKGTPILASDDNGGRNALETCTHYFLHRRHWGGAALPAAARLEVRGRAYAALGLPPAWTAEPAAAIVAARRNPFAVVETTLAAAPQEVREGDARSD